MVLVLIGSFCLFVYLYLQVHYNVNKILVFCFLFFVFLNELNFAMTNNPKWVITVNMNFSFSSNSYMHGAQGQLALGF